MGYIIKLTIILMVVSGVAAGSLALVNMKTHPIIVEYKKLVEEQARLEIFKEGVKFELCADDSTFPYYKVYSDEAGMELVGYIFNAPGKGYSSTIMTIAAVDTAFNIVGIKITSQQETPGLGSKCQEIKYGEKEPWFQLQYFKSYWEHHNKPPLNAMTVAVDKDNGIIHSITGATITTRAITNAIREKAKELQRNLQEAK